MISTLLSCFLKNNMKELLFFKKLVKILVSFLKRVDEVKFERSEVEDVFKLEKHEFFMDKDLSLSSFMLTYFS